MELSDKFDGKVALDLHTGAFRGSQQPFMMVHRKKCVIVNMPISSEMVIGLV